MGDRPAGFFLDELSFGTLNNFRDTAANRGADQRRQSSQHLLDDVLRKAFGRDALETVERFNGVIVAKRQVNRAMFQKKGPLITAYAEGRPTSTDTTPSAVPVSAPYFIYKVYIPELESRPYPLSAEDPVLQTYPDVHISTDVDMQYAELAIAGLVAVEYGDIENLLDPMIVEYQGASPLKWDGLKGNANEAAFKGGTRQRSGALLYERSAETSAGGSWGSTPSQRKMMEEAKKLKEIRQEIFLSTGDTRKTARGGLPGPFSKKSDRNWKGSKSNAILSLTDQKALKAKFQDKIDTIASSLGMKTSTLEKIFKKESGTFDPYAINHNTAATGLIQFMPEFSSAGTAKNLGTTVEELLTMGPDKQLDYVKLYFERGKKGNMSEEVDWYFIVFYPAAIGKSDDYVIGNARTAEVNFGYADPQHPENLITRRRVKERWG